MDEFRPVLGYEGLYEISQNGRLFAVERTLFQDDELGRRFTKTIKRHEKAVTVNGRGYRAFNLRSLGRASPRYR